MRKFITMILAVIFIVSFTGFAGAKVVDTGPPDKQQTTVKKIAPVSDDALMVVHLDVAEATYFPEHSAIYDNDPANLPTSPNVTASFIDRHRRSCSTDKDFNYTDIGRSTPYNSLAFIDRHRRSCNG